MIPDFAQSLFERFDREGIPLLLAGGWAVCHHGYSRFTNDIDWICSRDNETRAIDLMKSLRFQIVFESMATRFKHRDQLDIPFVDFIWVGAGSFSIMNSTDQRTGLHGDIPVINLETLLAMKLHALKDNEHRKGKDLLDIRILLSENANAITEERLMHLCNRYSSPQAYQMIRGAS